MLEVLGLDARTELVYRLVLEEPELRLDEIVARLGRSEDDVRRALDQLAELCLLDDGPHGAEQGPPVFRAWTRRPACRSSSPAGRPNWPGSSGGSKSPGTRCRSSPRTGGGGPAADSTSSSGWRDSTRYASG